MRERGRIYEMGRYKQPPSNTFSEVNDLIYFLHSIDLRVEVLAFGTALGLPVTEFLNRAGSWGLNRQPLDLESQTQRTTPSGTPARTETKRPL